MKTRSVFRIINPKRMDQKLKELKKTIFYLYIQILYVYLINFAMKNLRPKCGCGNTQNPDGFCDGSHLNH